MNSQESQTHFNRLTVSTTLFFLSFIAFAVTTDLWKEYEVMAMTSGILMLLTHFASLYFISSFVSSVGRSGIKYALGAFIFPFWGDAYVYYLCRKLATENGVV